MKILSHTKCTINQSLILSQILNSPIMLQEKEKCFAFHSLSNFLILLFGIWSRGVYKALFLLKLIILSQFAG